MTQLRFHPGSISNYFDSLLDGLGARGSSFSDIDAVSHDIATNRFLVQEFKREDEPIPKGQHWMLKGLSEIPKHFTVWHVIQRRDGQISFAEYGHQIAVIAVQEYQDRYVAWWANRQWEPPAPASSAPAFDEIAEERIAIQAELTAADIKW